MGDKKRAGQKWLEKYRTKKPTKRQSKRIPKKKSDSSMKSKKSNLSVKSKASAKKSKASNAKKYEGMTEIPAEYMDDFLWDIVADLASEPVDENEIRISPSQESFLSDIYSFSDINE